MNTIYTELGITRDEHHLRNLQEIAESVKKLTITPECPRCGIESDGMCPACVVVEAAERDASQIEWRASLGIGPVQRMDWTGQHPTGEYL